MKIFLVENNYDAAPDSAPVWRMVADSTLLYSGRPFFIPEFDDSFDAFVSPVVRIDRLGKNISPKFASRYYSEVTVGVNVRAKNLYKRLMENGLPSDASLAFDRSVIAGDFSAASAVKESGWSDIQVCIDGEVCATWNAEFVSRSVDEIIAMLSENNTLKTGDLIFFALHAVGVRLRYPALMTVSLDHTVLLETELR